jgi:hypothetical protein
LIMDDEDLQDFIDRQKPSSWGNVGIAKMEIRTAIGIFPGKRLNYESELIKRIDAALVSGKGGGIRKEEVSTKL